ncbi:uncharacterized protein LOC126597801 isoform X2 [Malus sylvestris]|uniref:uncharacterized protein LOC126597801 isoform X2 n=1 Tax=Malus sylvestris TaxID=3752 RepID=UPI0021ABEBAC|nr:uncharacterized protein LOC126597801 isoform X2 [Malus sylvestris]
MLYESKTFGLLMRYWSCSVNSSLHGFPLLKVRVSNDRECPTELREAISSIIFAAPRCSDVPDLMQITNLFAAKYGKEFVSAVSELRPDSGVNRTIIEKLSVSAPSGEARLKVLKEIAKEYKLNWDSSDTEAEFSKKHEDLLGGPKHISGAAAPSQAPAKQITFSSLPANGAHSIVPADIKQEPQYLNAPRSLSKTPSFTNEIQPSANDDKARPVSETKGETRPQSSDILERARAAIASAERASAAARQAAELVKSL